MSKKKTGQAKLDDEQSQRLFMIDMMYNKQTTDYGITKEAGFDRACGFLKQMQDELHANPKIDGRHPVIGNDVLFKIGGIMCAMMKYVTAELRKPKTDIELSDVADVLSVATNQLLLNAGSIKNPSDADVKFRADLATFERSNFIEHWVQLSLALDTHPFEQNKTVMLLQRSLVLKLVAMILNASLVRQGILGVIAVLFNHAEGNDAPTVARSASFVAPLLAAATADEISRFVTAMLRAAARFPVTAKASISLDTLLDFHGGCVRALREGPAQRTYLANCATLAAGALRSAVTVITKGVTAKFQGDRCQALFLVYLTLLQKETCKAQVQKCVQENGARLMEAIIAMTDVDDTEAVFEWNFWPALMTQLMGVYQYMSPAARAHFEDPAIQDLIEDVWEQEDTRSLIGVYEYARHNEAFRNARLTPEFAPRLLNILVNVFEEACNDDCPVPNAEVLPLLAHVIRRSSEWPICYASMWASEDLWVDISGSCSHMVMQHAPGNKKDELDVLNKLLGTAYPEGGGPSEYLRALNAPVYLVNLATLYEDGLECLVEYKVLSPFFIVCGSIFQTVPETGDEHYLEVFRDATDALISLLLQCSERLVPHERAFLCGIIHQALSVETPGFETAGDRIYLASLALPWAQNNASALGALLTGVLARMAKEISASASSNQQTRVYISLGLWALLEFACNAPDDQRAMALIEIQPAWPALSRFLAEVSADAGAHVDAREGAVEAAKYAARLGLAL